MNLSAAEVLRVGRPPPRRPRRARAVSDYLGKALLVPVLRELLEERVPLRFEIATTHSREGVRLAGLGEVDCAVVTGQESPRGLEAERLFDQPFVWVGPDGPGGACPCSDSAPAARAGGCWRTT